MTATYLPAVHREDNFKNNEMPNVFGQEGIIQQEHTWTAPGGKL